MKNIFGDYQVWTMYGSAYGSYIDSFDTQKEAQDYIEDNYSLWKNPKWEITADSRPTIKTKIKGGYGYDGVCITVKSPGLKKPGDLVKLFGQLKFGELVGFVHGTSSMYVSLEGKIGEIIDAKLKDSYEQMDIVYTIKFSLFGENVLFTKVEHFSQYEGISSLKINPIVVDKINV